MSHPSRHFDSGDGWSSLPESSPTPGRSPRSPGLSPRPFSPAHRSQAPDIARSHALALAADSNPDTQAQAVLYSQALLFHMQEQLARLIEANDALRNLVKTTFDTTLHLNKLQIGEIVRIARFLILQPGRTQFENTALLAEAFPMVHRDCPSIIEAAQEHARTGEVQLKSIIAHYLSTNKNIIRRFLRDSVYDSKPKPLAETATDAHSKFVSGPLKQDKPSVEFIIHILLLRQYCRDNAAILVSHEVGQSGKKRRRIQNGSHAVEGEESFWRGFGRFLESCIEKWGRNLRAGDWALYINKCLATEQEIWPDYALPILPLPSSMLPHAASTNVNMLGADSLPTDAPTATHPVQSSTVNDASQMLYHVERTSSSSSLSDGRSSVGREACQRYSPSLSLSTPPSPSSQDPRNVTIPDSSNPVRHQDILQASGPHASQASTELSSMPPSTHSNAATSSHAPYTSSWPSSQVSQPRPPQDQLPPPPSQSQLPWPSSQPTGPSHPVYQDTSQRSLQYAASLQPAVAHPSLHTFANQAPAGTSTRLPSLSTFLSSSQGSPSVNLSPRTSGSTNLTASDHGGTSLARSRRGRNTSRANRSANR
ncbi:hypothetical protein K474DRAFT_1702700 [Panus rudis PR-1116 ss-1]|nr:hypothetical protein K474DRAFT_1702700 [Panus rudis PR-1116 ss-1]